MKLGPSLKYALIDGFLPMLDHSPVCEFIPETWDPANERDVDLLLSIQKRATLLPHCITLNLLNDGPGERSIARIKQWIAILKLNWVSDHYCWSSVKGKSSGLAIPPLVSVEECIDKVSRVRDIFGVNIVLENIPTPFDEERHVLGYHESLLTCIDRTDFGLILDVENIRVDATNANMDPFALLKMYDGIEPTYIHVAGGRFNGILETDTHDQPCSDLTLALLQAVPHANDAMVIYERDYALDTDEINKEILRLRQILPHLGRDFARQTPPIPDVRA